MNVSREPVKNSASVTKEPSLPTEYAEKARQLVDKRNQAEGKLRAALSSCAGRDDRLSGKLRELDQQLRKDLSLLRKEYGLL